MTEPAMAIQESRILVSIGVSKPEFLDELPGVITASERMAAWGRMHGYHPVLIHDAKTPEHGPLDVTVDRIRAEVASAIRAVTSERALERLIVFFAGHGSALDPDQHWLLTHWRTNSSEAIKVRKLQRMLEFYGPKQVAIIADACQENNREFDDVIGSAVLLRPQPEEEPEQFELDRFLAADAGMKSFMVKAQGDEAAYCLFSEVLLDALEGDAEQAFETGGPEPCVTSQSLFTYIREEIPIAAGKLNLSMKPRPEAGFVTDRIYLRKSTSKASGPGPWDTMLRGGPRVPPTAPRGALEKVDGPSDEDRVAAEELDRNDRSKSMLERAEKAPLPSSFETGCGIVVWGARVSDISPSIGLRERHPDRPDSWFRLWLPERQEGFDWADVIIDLDDGRSAYACAVAGFIVAVQIYSANETGILHYKVDRGGPGRTALDLLAKANAGLLNDKQLLEAAATLRQEKHDILTIGPISAQFYDAIRDVDSIRRVASYYRQHEQIVPLDVALLTGGRIYAEGRQLFVDIAEVSERKPRSEVEEAHPYTYSATPGFERAQIGGRAPWLRSGWGAIDTATYDSSARAWRDAALAVVEHLAPGPFTFVKPEGRTALAKLVGIEDQRVDPTYASL
jgi:hypothetical protein